MKKRTGKRRGRLRRRAALRLALLMLPAFFWAVVFAALAGGGQEVGRVAGRVNEAAQIIVAATCLLLAALLGLAFVGDRGQRLCASPGRARIVSGASLFVLAALAALGSV